METSLGGRNDDFWMMGPILPPTPLLLMHCFHAYACRVDCYAFKSKYAINVNKNKKISQLKGVGLINRQIKILSISLIANRIGFMAETHDVTAGVFQSGVQQHGAIRWVARIGVGTVTEIKMIIFA